MTDEHIMDPAPAGWRAQNWRNSFADRAGPFYWREGDAPGVGFYAKAHHLNIAGVIHGGALLTLADMALFDILFRANGRFRGVTVTLNSEFAAPGKEGDFIESAGEPIMIGKSLMMARGIIKSGDRTLMSFSGVVKRLAGEPINPQPGAAG